MSRHVTGFVASIVMPGVGVGASRLAELSSELSSVVSGVSRVLGFFHALDCLAPGMRLSTSYVIQPCFHLRVIVCLLLSFIRQFVRVGHVIKPLFVHLMVLSHPRCKTSHT